MALFRSGCEFPDGAEPTVCTGTSLLTSSKTLLSSNLITKGPLLDLSNQWFKTKYRPLEWFYNVFQTNKMDKYLGQKIKNNLIE